MYFVTDPDRIVSDSFRSLPIPTESSPIVSDRYRSKYVDYLENFLKGFICIHILVTMDPRHTDAEDEQFQLNMIAEGQGDAPEQADDGSNIDIYLNKSGDGIEPPSIQDDAAGEQSANVHITTMQKKTKRGPTKKLEGQFIIMEV